MSIVSMKKLQFVGLERDRRELTRRLQQLGCVELRTRQAPEGYLSPVEPAGEEAQLHALRGQRRDAEAALKLLKEHAKEKSGLFAEKELICETDFYADIREEAIRAVGSILEAAQALTRCRDEQSTLRAQQERLRLWQDLPVPLDLQETGATRLFLGAVAASQPQELLQPELDTLGFPYGLRACGADRERRGILLVCMKGNEEAFAQVLGRFGYERAPAAGLHGTAEENIRRLQLELDAAAGEEAETRSFLKDCGRHRRLLKLWYDRLTLEIEAAEAQQKLLRTTFAFAMTGWVDAPHADALTQLFEAYCCAYELCDPQEGDVVPVQLQSNRLTAPMNMVTEMYSLPDYRNVDPNPLIMPFYCVFFGMMFNDLGYGLVFIVLSLLVQKKFRLQRGMKNMMQLMLECGVTTALMGLLTGSFFGDAIPQIAALYGKTVTMPALLNPLEDPLKILILSLALGAVQILFGMGVKAYILIRDGKPWDALMDVGSWWLLFAGVAVGALGGTWLVAAAGAAALILTQGRAKPTFAGKLVGGLASLYDITSYFSDILSYSRIMALMLAGGIVASIVNILGGLFGNIFLFIPIFIIGHAFNIGINVIGTYVHAARLQYLEFFGKFYVDGGKAFRPLSVKTKYFDIIKEEANHG